MGEEKTLRSASGLNNLKPGSAVFSKSLKAASTLLKSISSMNSKKSQASGGSVEQSISVIMAVGKSESSNISQSKSGMKLIPQNETNLNNEDQTTNPNLNLDKSFSNRKRTTKFMKKYPELFRDDVSVNPSYTGLRKFPYNVVCRQRFHKNKSKINRQLNKEIENITMTQTLALDGVRVGRIFSVGFPTSETFVKDFASSGERRRLNRILDDR